MHDTFYLYHVDNAWEVAKTYYYIKLGITEDVLFRSIDAPDRIQLFCKGFYFLLGNTLELFGWTKSNALWFSSFFLWLTSLVWFFILRSLHFSKKVAGTFSFLMLLYPAFFSAAHLARADTLALCAASFGFLLFIHRRYILACFVVMVAFEFHVMGSIGAFYILAFVLDQRKYFFSKKNLALKVLTQCLIGVLLGSIYYYIMHMDVLSFELLHTILSIKKQMPNPLKNYLISYFIHDRWFVHIFEFFVIVVSIRFFIFRKLYQNNSFVGTFMLVLIVSSFITQRPNKHYMVFAFPAFLLAIVYTFESMKRTKELVATSLVLIFSVNAYLYIQNRNYDFEKLTKEIQLHTPKKNQVIVGMPDNWFGAVGREFYPIYHSVTYLYDLDFPEIYLIKNDYISRHSKNYKPLVSYYLTHYNCRPTHQIDAGENRNVEIFDCSRNPKLDLSRKATLQ
ncbi:MAG: hypothetical protein KDD52_09095 [Bdellovibrionales bacterium]|nr:hypothetical protein [Bdellovibrionales bacterium]